MISRKWSLLTGPAAIFGSIVVVTAVAKFIFVESDHSLNQIQGSKIKFLQPTRQS
ncbi:hypothetical protein NMG60_11022761 [Bertholletia excelsa]